MKKAIHCKTKEEFKKVLEYIESKGGKWIGGDKPTESIDCWYDEEKNTCLNVSDIDNLEYARLAFYTDENYTILTPNQYMIKSFDNPQIGDEYKNEDGGSQWVLGVSGRVIFLSCRNNKNNYYGGFTKEELIKQGYTIVQDTHEEEITELTMDEVAKLAGVEVSKLKIKK